MNFKTGNEKYPIDQNWRKWLLVYPGNYFVREPLMINTIESHGVLFEILSICIIEEINLSVYGAGLAYQSQSKKSSFQKGIERPLILLFLQGCFQLLSFYPPWVRVDKACRYFPVTCIYFKLAQKLIVFDNNATNGIL